MFAAAIPVLRSQTLGKLHPNVTTGPPKRFSVHETLTKPPTARRLSLSSSSANTKGKQSSARRTGVRFLFSWYAPPHPEGVWRDMSMERKSTVIGPRVANPGLDQHHTVPGPDCQVNVWHSLDSTMESDRIQQDGVVGLDPTAMTLLQKK